MSQRQVSLVSVGLVVGATVLGCSPTRVYSVRQDWAGKQEFLAARDQSSEPNPTGREVLGRATTIAFRPPNACTEVKAAGAGTTEQSNVLRLQCGVLISELESEATNAGFEVVSWQVLKDGVTIDRARENRVDVLFEINELSFDFPPQQIYSASSTTFLDNGAPRAVSNAVQVAQRCEQRFLPGLPAVDAVTLDLKMVAVGSGRVGWYYRAVESGKPIEDLSLGERYTVAPTGGALGDMDSTLLGLGAGFAGVGLVLAIVGQQTATPELVLGGMASLAGGALGLGVGALAMVINALTLSYPDPAEVICLQPPDPAPGAVAQASPQTASTVTLQQRTDVNRSDKEEEQRRMLKTVVRHFMAKVAAHRLPPAPAPAPSLAPAPAPAPAPELAPTPAPPLVPAVEPLPAPQTP